MAASAKMSFNYYQNGKYGTLPSNPQKDMEVTGDMHLKMSKKIAQLTKVIYALNTKNDEHDGAIQSLKDQHEEEIQKILSETKEKISVFKRKLDEDMDYRRKMSSLETTIMEHEKHKKEAMLRFETFKRQAEDREIQLKKDNSEKILSISHDVLSAKKEFEEQLAKFNSWKKEVDSEKEKCLQDLKKAHEKEMEDLRQFHRGQNSDWLNEVAKVENKYKSEVEQLNLKCEQLVADKSKLADDYEQKLNKAQAFYEKELAALKNSKNSSEEQLSAALREEQERMRKEFFTQQSEMKKRIESLVDQLSISEEEMEKYKKQLEDLESNLNDKDKTSSSLQQQLKEAKQKASEALTKLKEVESELSVTKERCNEQAKDLLQKSGQIGELEGTNIQKTSKINDLQKEVNKFKDRLSWLESERKNLELEKDSLSEEKLSQLRSLEKSLEDLSIEKQTLITRYERDIQKLVEKSESQVKDLTEKHASELSELKKKMQAEMNLQQQKAENTLTECKQQYMKKYTDDTTQLIKEKDTLKQEYEKIKSELSSRLNTAELEIARLNKILHDSEAGLGSASSKINSLKDASMQLQTELEKTRDELRTAKNNAATYKAELEKLRSLYESKMKEAKEELHTQLEKLSKDLETKWSDTLRTETARLKHDITQQKDDERKAALQQLSKLKDEELVAAKAGWERIIAEMQKQMAALEHKISRSHSESAEEIDRFRKEAEEEKRKLERKIVEVSEEYSRNIKSMESSHEQEKEKLQRQKIHETEDLERRLKSAHMEDMQVHLTAHRAAMEGVKSEAEEKRLAEIESLSKKHKNEIATVRDELSSEHQKYVDEVEKAHNSQMHAARIELERAIEISRQKDKDHSMKVEDLQSEIGHRERHINNLKEEIHGLKENIEKLIRELEAKGKEILKVRSDANLQIKKKEEVLTKQFKNDLENVKTDHNRETQEMIAEFTEAQELLKDKISEIQIALEEANERYRTRESRPEDLELIEQLRNSVLEKEQRMKQLIDEKRYYQMELVNRETNFNKVFNTTPNVGVMNPLQKKPKKGDKNLPMKHSSSPSLNSSHQRLDPLPNSPIHNENLNPSRPLPSFTKKFVK